MTGRMQFEQPEQKAGERRYDPETLREVAALAHRLQESQRETLTAEQIEGIAEEAGLGRTFVREALAQLALQHSRAGARSARAAEFRDLAAGWGVCALGSLLAWLAAVAAPAAAAILTLILLPLLGAAIGFLIGKGRAAMGAAGVLAFALGLVAALAPGAGGWGAALAHLTIGAPLGVWLAWQGARVREHFFPRGSGEAVGQDPGGVSSPALLDLLVTVQRQLDQRAQRRAFLSLEVVGARELRREAPETVVTEALQQFEAWVEELVRKAGGECRGTAADGLTCIFPTDAGAVSVARELQEGMSRFNTERSRLSVPLRIRCGISAGAIAEEPGRTSEALEAAFIERAGELRKLADPGDILVTAELAAAALLELRSLAPVSREAGADPVFSWRAGLRAHQHP